MKKDDFQDKDRKKNRRDSLQNKRYKNRYEADDFSPKDFNKGVKRKKEEYEDEEWKDWDQYYNH